jgi:hypothetical protein
MGASLRLFCRVRNSGVVHIYHLLFTDDILLFSKANPKHLRFLCALYSEVVSNLKINLSKSELVLMSNIGLASNLGCMVSSLPINSRPSFGSSF